MLLQLVINTTAVKRSVCGVQFGRLLEALSLKEWPNCCTPSFLLDDAKSFKQLSVLTVLHTEGFIDKPKNTDPMPDGVFGKSTARAWSAL